MKKTKCKRAALKQKLKYKILKIFKYLPDNLSLVNKANNNVPSSQQQENQIEPPPHRLDCP